MTSDITIVPGQEAFLVDAPTATRSPHRWIEAESISPASYSFKRVVTDHIFTCSHTSLTNDTQTRVVVNMPPIDIASIYIFNSIVLCIYAHLQSIVLKLALT